MLNIISKIFSRDKVVSKRPLDMKVEREIARFLDTYLYSKPLFSYYRRTDNIDDQFMGSDIVISIPSKNINNAVVDEKAQTQYINHPLPTFSLELSFINSAGNWNEGWFVDMEKKTEYYLFAWINKADKDKVPTFNQIHELEYALVKRSKIIDYLNRNGYPLQKLQLTDQEIRATNIYGAHHKSPSVGFYFFYSTQLAEKPVNIIIRKYILNQLSDANGVIIA